MNEIAKFPVVQSEARCRFCGYCLKTLSFMQLCPECGYHVYESVRLALTLKRRPGADAAAHRLTMQRLHDAIEECGFQPRIVLLVLSVLTHVRQETGKELSARDFCAAFRDFALMHFGGENKAICALAEYRIRGSEDVGKIVYALVKVQLLQESQGDSIRDFDGLFTLDTLFQAEL